MCRFVMTARMSEGDEDPAPEIASVPSFMVPTQVERNFSSSDFSGSLSMGRGRRTCPLPSRFLGCVKRKSSGQPPIGLSALFEATTAEDHELEGADDAKVRYLSTDQP